MAVLSVLAVGGAHGATRDRLVSLLWGEVGESRARHNLSDTLYGIHQDLGGEAVTAVGQVLYLNGDVVSTDLAEFHAGLQTGDRAAAVALYRGPFLDGFHVAEAPAFDEWLGAARQRLASLHAEALEALAHAAVAAGDQPVAARWWRRLLAADSLNSPAAIGLARALAATGDRANAMEILVSHRDLLRAELGMDAGRDILEAMEEVRAAAPSAPHRRAEASLSPTVPSQPASSPAQAAAPPAAAVSRLRRATLVAALAATIVIGVLIARALLPGPLVITATDITPVTSEPGFEFQPAISPDGKEVAFLAGPIGLPHVVIRSAGAAGGSGEVRLRDTVLGTQWYPSWSADGELVRFWSSQGMWTGRWMETGRLGGAVRAVTAPGGPTESAWSPDDSSVAFVIADTLFTAKPADGTRRLVVVHRDSIVDLHSLAWSPDGRRIAYVSGNSMWQVNATVAGSAIWVVPAAGGEPKRVTTHDHLNVSPVWLDATHLLFVSNRDGPRGVYAVEVGPRGPLGDAVAIPGVADPYSISYSVKARRLAYAKLTVPQNIWVYPLGRAEPVSIREGRPLTAGIQVIEEHDVSPDGQWIVYDSNLRGNMDLYKMSVTGGPAERLTDSPGNEFHPRWSPDGTEIAFHADLPGARGRSTAIMVIPAAGGMPAVLTHRQGADRDPEWSPDGLRLVFQSDRRGRSESWVVSRDSVGGSWHEAVRLTDAECCAVGWAPDGSGVLSVTGSSLILVSPAGRVLWRRDLAATTRLTVVFGGWRYSRDGSTIFLAANHADGRRGVWAIGVAGGEPRLVILNDDPTLINMDFHSVGPDELYVTVAKPESDIWVMRLRY
jgi:Tol biopolymer transport system component/DNA-binding SARP family transcriptional activator